MIFTFLRKENTSPYSRRSVYNGPIEGVVATYDGFSDIPDHTLVVDVDSDVWHILYRDGEQQGRERKRMRDRNREGMRERGTSGEQDQ